MYRPSPHETQNIIHEWPPACGFDLGSFQIMWLSSIITRVKDFMDPCQLPHRSDRSCEEMVIDNVTFHLDPKAVAVKHKVEDLCERKE